MQVIDSFVSPEDKEIENLFLSQGYIVKPVDNRAALDEFRNGIVEIACKHLGIAKPSDPSDFLNNIHKQVPISKLNDLRVAVFGSMNSLSWFKPTYYALARSALESVVGNELVMQNKVNLSVQYPEDRSSLLSIHADTWSDESPYQVVVWLPLVDVYDTKSMYLLPPAKNREAYARLKDIAKEGGSDKLYENFKEDFKWIPVPYGSVMLFSPNLLHGNIINQTAETRWSMNCRFKSLFSPYLSEEKRLGTFYTPITVKPVSRVGINYKDPEGFNE